MFSKLSRYRGVPDVVAPDAQGQAQAAKDIRLLPEVTGTFTHTVDSGDRLDQLAFTYYSQPLQYWRICDANPQFLSPLALLGKEPVVTTRFPVTAPSGDPPWAALFHALSTEVGVEDMTVVEDVVLTSQLQTVDGKQISVVVEDYSRAVLVTYNRLNSTASHVASVIAKAGFTVGQPVEGSQLGQQIIIPVAVRG
jgi:hypothetical protein